MNLHGFHGYNLGTVIGPDKLRSANPQLAEAGFDFVILHPARFVGGSAVHKLVA